MESHWMMVLHSVVIGLVGYVAMVFGLGQSSVVAERRSILLYAVALAYMLLFGHGLPLKLKTL
jgi:hypothetical protein